MKRMLVFAPTYNEADNIEDLIQKIFQYLPEQEVLVVDDASPDGTGKILDQLKKSNDHIHVIHRPQKLGLGTAHKLAMKYAIHYKFDILITMDADFSHNPKYLPTLVSHMSENDFVIGSRYIKGGGSENGFFRILLSQTVNILARSILRIPLRECTTSYRGFQVSLLKKLKIDAILSEGYSFFFESVLYTTLLADKISEFPIYFEDRRAGHTKISRNEIIKGILCLLRLFYKLHFFDMSKGITEKNEILLDLDCTDCGSVFYTEISHIASSHGLPEKNQAMIGSENHKLQCLQCGKTYYVSSNLSGVDSKAA